MKKSSVLLLFSIGFNQLLFAQNNETITIENPPVNFEFLVGNNGYAYQITINKSFRAVPKLGVFSVSNMSSKWGETFSKDMMSQIHLTYQFVKGFKFLTGTHYTPITGLRPNMAVMYSYSTKTFFFTIMPRIDLSKNSNWEGFAMIEYRPEITEKWSVYSRLQSLYSATLNNGNHSRSYVLLRAGFSYLDFRFGLGANLDTYGAEKISKQNYGLFMATNIFN